MSTVAVVTVAELTINEVKVDTPVTLKSSWTITVPWVESNSKDPSLVDILLDDAAPTVTSPKNPSEKEVPFVPIPADLSEVGLNEVLPVRIPSLNASVDNVDTPVTLKSSWTITVPCAESKIKDSFLVVIVLDVASPTVISPINASEYAVPAVPKPTVFVVVGLIWEETVKIPVTATPPLISRLPVILVLSLILTVPDTLKLSSTVVVPPAESMVKLPEAVSISLSSLIPIWILSIVAPALASTAAANVVTPLTVNFWTAISVAVTFVSVETPIVASDADILVSVDIPRIDESLETCNLPTTVAPTPVVSNLLELLW